MSNHLEQTVADLRARALHLTTLADQLVAVLSAPSIGSVPSAPNGTPEPRPAKLVKRGKLDVLPPLPHIRPPRATPQPATGSPIALLTQALAAMEGNFTSLDLRNKMRELGAPQSACANTQVFLKRRVARDELTEIEHNGEIFYCHRPNATRNTQHATAAA